jgi:uncharacterized protein YegL
MMRGERIEAVKNGLDAMVGKLRQDPFALESVFISIIRFDRFPELMMPLTELELLQIPDIRIPQAGPPNTGAALEFLCEQMEGEYIGGSEGTRGDWKPLLFILTRSVPADEEKFNVALNRVRHMSYSSIVVGILDKFNGIPSLCSPRAEEVMKRLTPQVVHLDPVDILSLWNRYRGGDDTSLLCSL